MIRLTKLDEPQSLIRNKARWTEELLEVILTGDSKAIYAKKKKYNQPDVKIQLRTETQDKCAYCESRVTVVAHGDIEHVTPKSIDPNLTFEWDNLTFACQICNQRKLDKTGITDPYHDPVDDFTFLAPPFLVGTTAQARLTILELTLNRPELIEDRLEHIEMLSKSLEAIENETDKRLRDLMLAELNRDLDTGKPEYIALKKAILAAFENR